MFLTLKQFRSAVFGVCTLFLFLMGYLLATSSLIFAQTASDHLQSPEQLVRQASQLAKSEEQFPPAIQLYSHALKLYREAGDHPHESETRQALEEVLNTAHPWFERQDRQIRQELAAFNKQFPNRESNATASQIEQLAGSKLNLVIRGGGSLPPIPPNEKQEQQNLFLQLKDNFDYLAFQQSDSLDGLPDNVLAYLKKHGATIAKIETILKTQELPQWAIDLTYVGQGNTEYAHPSFLGAINLQRLILADVISKNSPAQIQERLDALEASWKLSQSLQDDPNLISQLVSLISMRLNASVIRRLSGLPTEWQTRLIATDFRLKMLDSLKVESFFSYFSLSKIKGADLQKDFNESDSLRRLISAIGFDQWTESMQKNYLRWIAIRNYRQRQRLYGQLTQENICSYDVVVEDALLQKLGIKAEEKDSSLVWVSQWLKAGRTMLELELTQKILQLKQDAIAHPQRQVISSGDLEGTSIVCRDLRWAFRASVYGRTIIFPEPFPVSLSSSRGGLPLTHVIEPLSR